MEDIQLEKEVRLQYQSTIFTDAALELHRYLKTHERKQEFVMEVKCDGSCL